MLTYRAHLSKKARDYANASCGDRYEYRGGTIVTLKPQKYHSDTCFSSRTRVYDVAVGILNGVTTNYSVTKLFDQLIRCEVCAVESHTCWLFTGSSPKHICATCAIYLTKCLANESEIACQYTEHYSPFIIAHVERHMIIVTFIEENAITWCNSINPMGLSIRTEYRYRLKHHAWLYAQAMYMFIDSIRNIIVNFALDDNEFGLDLVSFCAQGVIVLLTIGLE